MDTSQKNWPLIAFFCGFLAIILILFLCLPPKSVSSVEKRTLEPFPPVSLSAIANGNFEAGMDRYLSDHIPGRTWWVGAYSYFCLATGRNGWNGIYAGKDGYLLREPTPPDYEALTRNLSYIRRFLSASEIPAAVMIVPSTGAVLPDKLPQNHDVYYDAELLSLAETQLESSATWIDLSASFGPLAELEPLYYRTDHHWTSLGAYRAYEALLSQWSISPTPSRQFQVTAHPDFYGTSYSKSALWGVKPDTMEIWDLSLPVQVLIYEDPAGEASASSSMFYLDNLDGDDPYSVFLNGNHALTRIVNPSASGGTLLILKDSFANCLAPFLAAHFREIDLIDLRYYRPSGGLSLLEDTSADQILFVYSLDDLVEDPNFMWLAP